METSNKNQRKKNQKEDNKHKGIQEKQSNAEMRYTFSTIEGRCYICGKPGHKSPQCKLKTKIPKEEWAITKAKQSYAMKIDEHTNQKRQIFSCTSSYIHSACQHYWFHRDVDMLPLYEIILEIYLNS